MKAGKGEGRGRRELSDTQLAEKRNSFLLVEAPHSLHHIILRKMAFQQFGIEDDD